MYAVIVSITRYIDDSFPGWVECKLIDAHNREIAFVEKAPVVSSADLGTASLYPQEGMIACRVIERWRDQGGVAIDTDVPWSIESTGGESCFEVLAEQLTEIDNLST
ncbi:MAG: hypothetical protein JXB07_13430 [Anaerolineae bacterium]|nr:hypothetical protein [Anaerolineae bacterium]